MPMLHASEFRFTCPKCGTSNSVTAGEISNDYQVQCPACNSSVGAWGNVHSNADENRLHNHRIAG